MTDEYGSLPEEMGEDFWNDRYRSGDRIWSGRPNRHLVSEIEGVQPGRALDVGAGEGADALWLARQGFSVHAYDYVPSAARAVRDAAELEGLDADDAAALLAGATRTE